MKCLVSIVIPLYNESESVLSLMEEISSYQNRLDFNFEILFVNDGSTDDTKSIILNSEKYQFQYSLISLSKNFGSHAAIRAGFLYAKGDYAVYLPADLQISFNDLQKLYNASLEGFDIVTGIRKDYDIGFFEKTFSKFYAKLIRKYVVSIFPDEGLETLLINKKVLLNMNNNIEGNSSFALQILSMGFRNKYITIDKRARKLGSSKWTLSKKIKLLIDSFIAFSYAPVRFVTAIGFGMFVFGIVFSGYLIFRKIFYDDLASGWPMLISLIITGFGITNISLGIIAEYLWRTLDAARKRPVFIIDDIIELNKNE